MKLYDCLIAPNPRRVRIFLAEKGIEVPSEEVDILHARNLEPDFVAINPRAIVPTLVLDDGAMLDESLAICRYFEETHPEPPLMGRTALEKATIECWERRADQDGMLSARDFIRNQVPVFDGRGHPGRRGDAQIEALVERGKNGMRQFHDVLERQLDTHPFVAGEAFSVADITAICAVDLGRLAEFPGLDGYPAIAAWRERMDERPSVEDWLTNMQSALAALG